MIVTFNKTVLDAGGRNYSIMFKGQSDYPCNVNATMLSNTVGDTIQLVADYNECGIDVYQNNSVITYNQTVMVSYGENPASSVIFRVNYDEYSLKCHKSNNLTASMDVFNVTAEGKVFSKGTVLLISFIQWFHKKILDFLQREKKTCFNLALK